jgi:hypothetical protein
VVNIRGIDRLNHVSDTVEGHRIPVQNFLTKLNSLLQVWPIQWCLFLKFGDIEKIFLVKMRLKLVAPKLEVHKGFESSDPLAIITDSFQGDSFSRSYDRMVVGESTTALQLTNIEQFSIMFSER